MGGLVQLMLSATKGSAQEVSYDDDIAMYARFMITVADV